MSFTQTSTHVAVNEQGHLSAHCQRSDGTVNASVLDLNTLVGNQEGVLTWGGSNFSQTSTHVAVNAEGHLSAHCQTSAGEVVPSVLNLNSWVSNNEGNLSA